MAAKLRERMDMLRAIAPRLNATTDQASKLVAAVERLLVKELSIGVSAEAEFDGTDRTDEEGRRVHDCRSLAFGRTSAGTFCIHVLEETGVLDRDGQWDYSVSKQVILWPSCSREMKLQSFEKLPELLSAIIAKAEQLAKTADETASKVEELMGAVVGAHQSQV
jgi:hypothetical protein